MSRRLGLWITVLALPLAALGLPTAVLAGFALVLTAVATRVFRWDDV